MNQAPRLDTRFLRIHPVTAKWWEQREKCRTCANHIGPTAEYPNPGEFCRAAPWLARGWHQNRYENCIDARAAEGERKDGRPGICGPDAVLWEPKA